MNPIENILNASNMGKSESVPLALLAGGEYISWFTGMSKSYYYGDDYKLKLGAQLEFVTKFPKILFWPGLWPDYGSVIEPSSFGCTVTLSKEGEPIISSHAIKDLDEVDVISVPDIKRDGLIPRALDNYKYIVDKTPRGIKERYGYANGFAFTMGPCDLAVQVLGYENFILGIHTEKSTMNKLMRLFTRTIEEWINAQWDVSGDRKFVFIIEDSISLLGPEQFRELIFPHIRDLCNKIKSKENKIILHNCDKTSHLVESIGRLPIDIFHHSPEHNTGWWKKEFGNKFCIAGGISPFQGLLENYESLEKEIRNTISSGMPGGGFILSISGSLPIGTYAETIMGISSLIDKKF